MWLFSNLYGQPKDIEPMNLGLDILQSPTSK